METPKSKRQIKSLEAKARKVCQCKDSHPQKSSGLMETDGTKDRPLDLLSDNDSSFNCKHDKSTLAVAEKLDDDDLSGQTVPAHHKLCLGLSKARRAVNCNNFCGLDFHLNGITPKSKHHKGKDIAAVLKKMGCAFPTACSTKNVE